MLIPYSQSGSIWLEEWIGDRTGPTLENYLFEHDWDSRVQ